MPSFCYNVYPYLIITNGTKFEFTKQEYFTVLAFEILFFELLAQYFDKVEKLEIQDIVQLHLMNKLGINRHQLYLFLKQKAVQIYDLNKQFGKTRAVDGVMLQIYESQILCLLGHNGAGKTTAISLLTSLIKKDSGGNQILWKKKQKKIQMIQEVFLVFILKKMYEIIV